MISIWILKNTVEPKEKFTEPFEIKIIRQLLHITQLLTVFSRPLNMTKYAQIQKRIMRKSFSQSLFSSADPTSNKAQTCKLPRQKMSLDTCGVTRRAKSLRPCNSTSRNCNNTFNCQ